MVSDNTEPPMKLSITSHHSLVSASGSSIWLNCPGSVFLSSKVPEPSSTEWALEGTRAHSLAEMMVKKRLELLNEDKFEAWLNELPTLNKVEPEMVAHCLSYVRVIEEELRKFDNFPKGVSAKTEVRMVLDADKNMFCTSDFLASGQKGGRDAGLVVDLKYGQGVPVSAKGNPQLAYYMAALLKNSKRQLKFIKGIIVQPRVEEWYSEVEYSEAEVRTWHGVLLEGAQRALEQFLRKETSVVFKAGEHCRFCKAKPVCSTHMQYLEAQAGMDFMEKKTREIDLIPMLSPESLSHILGADKEIRAFLDAVNAKARDLILSGETVPGYKVVPGRSVRRWKDEGNGWQDAVKALGVEPLESSPKSVAAIEKEVGKENFKALEPFVIKPEGKPTVVPIEDKRLTLDVGGDF